MKIAPLPPDEPARLAELRKYDILDTEPDAAFEGMVQLARYICQTSIAAISLVDENRQWFKAIVGLGAKETTRDVAFCAHAILQDEPLVVPDALQDERFHDNPLVSGSPDIRFYAGVPLTTSSGYRLGTLCVIDHVPRQLLQEQMDAIKTLADSVMAHLDLRLSHKKIRGYVDDLQLAASIFESASEAMVVTDPDNRIITANPAFSAMTGYALNEVVGRNPSLLSAGKQGKEFYQKMWDDLKVMGHWSGELWNRRKNGELYAEWLSINIIFNDDGTKRMHLAIFSDVTKKKHADEIIWKQANYDSLTQLPNRRLFRDRLEQEIKMVRRTGRSLTLIFIDLDHFKEINDTLGHDIGDLLLVDSAKRISDSVREADTVARMGGDEFVIFLPQLDAPRDIDRVANTIIKKLAQPFDLNGHTVKISASVGIAVYPQHAANAEELLSNADKAMYRAKAQGRGQYRCHDDPPLID